MSTTVERQVSGIRLGQVAIVALIIGSVVMSIFTLTLGDVSVNPITVTVDPATTSAVYSGGLSAVTDQ